MTSLGYLKSEFEEQGYIQCPGFFTDDEMSTLLKEIKTVGQSKIKESRLNKDNMVFYHNIYKHSEYARAFIAQLRIVELLNKLIGPDFWVRWDQAIGKYPGGNDFPWHQDNAYNRLKERHFQVWVGLTDMRQENGGLWLQPGSHKLGHLPHCWQDNHLVCAVQPKEEVFVDARKGDVIVFSSMMLHRTTKNTSESERWAYVVELMSLDDYDPYIQAPYFIVAEDGQPNPRLVRTYRGKNLKNQGRYFYYRVRDKLYKAVGSKKTPTVMAKS